MPNIKSAKKRVLVIKRRTLKNKIYVSALRTAIKKALNKDNENRAQSVKIALKLLDKSVSKGILHKNTAARKKAAIVRSLA